MRRALSVAVYAWVALFGVWPIADPGHGDSVLAQIDVGLHIGAGICLLSMLADWYVARRVHHLIADRVTAVLDLHRPRPDWAPINGPVCRVCWTEAPCPTVRALTDR